MASAATLYTPEILALATSLATYPWDDAHALQASARSRSCGSTLTLGITTGIDNYVTAVGLKTQACAIGQAAAAIFAAGAPGRMLADIAGAGAAIAAWLSGGSALPEWPGLAAIAPARDYPGRHGAILLAWQAASDLLPKAPIHR